MSRSAWAGSRWGPPPAAAPRGGTGLGGGQEQACACIAACTPVLHRTYPISTQHLPPCVRLAPDLQPASPWFLVVARPTLSVQQYPRQVRAPPTGVQQCKGPSGSRRAVEGGACRKKQAVGSHAGANSRRLHCEMQEDLTAFRIPHGVFVKMHAGTWHAGTCCRGTCCDCRPL